jgi:hypothetical protein
MNQYVGQLLVFIGQNQVESEKFYKVSLDQLIKRAQVLKGDMKTMVQYQEKNGEYAGLNKKQKTVTIKLQGKFPNEIWKEFNKAVNRG